MYDLAKLFQALSDEARLRILNLLIHTGKLCVCDMQRILQFSQPKVSRHLTYLKHAGLVVDERRGMWVIYSVTNVGDKTTKRLLKELKDIFDLNKNLKVDLGELNKAIKEGTCMTYCHIYPERTRQHNKRNMNKRISK